MVSLRVQNRKGGLSLGAIVHAGRVVVLATGAVPLEAVDEARAFN